MAKPGVRTTALRRYALLESTGVHVDGAGAAPQEVVVRFGESTLTLQDFDDTPVAHWALAGLRRLHGSGPEELRLAPDMDGEERLVIRVPACPAVRHMRRQGYPVARLFHETTRTVNEALCEGTPFCAELAEYDPETGRSVQIFTCLSSDGSRGASA